MEKFLELYNNNSRLIYSFVYKYTKDYDTVNEIASTVWLKVAKDLDKYLAMESQHLKNYLKAVVRTTYADYYKAQKRDEKNIEELKVIVGGKFDETNYVEDELFFVDNLAYLRKAVHNLKEDEIELLTLKFENNMKWSEIASLYNTSEGCIRTRQSRIYKKLRNRIEQMIEADEVIEDEYK